VGTGAALALILSGSAPADAGSARPGSILDYQSRTVHVVQHSVTQRGSAFVHDISYSVAGQPAVDAYLVTPASGGRHPAAMFLHWLDTPDVSNRGEFLDEAVGLAQQGLISLLPQLVFPITVFPVGDPSDRSSIVAQTIQLRRGLDLLDARPDVDRHRVAVVGHDYGAMYASLIGTVDRDRLAALVIMAADATFSNWFVLFFLALDPDQVGPYQRLFQALDPINYIGHGARPLLMQYASNDFFIPNGVAFAMASAAGHRADFRMYDTDHSLQIPAAQTGRDAFLTRTLHI
jgi:dienelactone hydrolase